MEEDEDYGIHARETADGSDPVYYYSRAHRLQSAPKLVKDLYAGNIQTAPKGLFRTLVYTRSSRLMLCVSVAVFVMVLFFRAFGADSSQTTVAGVPVGVTAFSFEDTVYVSVRCGDTEQPVAGTDGALPFFEMTVRAFDASGACLAEKELSGEITGKDDCFRTTFTDYDIISIVVVIKSGDEEKTADCKVAHT